MENGLLTGYRYLVEVEKVSVTSMDAIEDTVEKTTVVLDKAEQVFEYLKQSMTFCTNCTNTVKITLLRGESIDGGDYES